MQSYIQINWITREVNTILYSDLLHNLGSLDDLVFRITGELGK